MGDILGEPLEVDVIMCGDGVARSFPRQEPGDPLDNEPRFFPKQVPFVVSGDEEPGYLVAGIVSEIDGKPCAPFLMLHETGSEQVIELSAEDAWKLVDIIKALPGGPQ